MNRDHRAQAESTLSIGVLVFTFAFLAAFIMGTGEILETMKGIDTAEEASEAIITTLVEFVILPLILTFTGFVAVGAVKEGPAIYRLFTTWIMEGSQEPGPLPDWLQSIYDYVVEPLDRDS